MARYFFHLRTGNGDKITDEYGDALPDARAAEEHAIASAGDLLRHSALKWLGASFEVYDHSNRHVVTVWFREVASVGLRSEHRSPPDDQHA
jgi:hypothetical protein